MVGSSVGRGMKMRVSMSMMRWWWWLHWSWGLLPVVCSCSTLAILGDAEWNDHPAMSRKDDFIRHLTTFSVSSILSSILSRVQGIYRDSSCHVDHSESNKQLEK